MSDERLMEACEDLRRIADGYMLDGLVGDARCDATEAAFSKYLIKLLAEARREERAEAHRKERKEASVLIRLAAEQMEESAKQLRGLYAEEKADG